MTERNKNQWNRPGCVCSGDSAGVPYSHPQPGGLVAVREFLFAEAEGERVVLLRWAMEADFSVDRFTFNLEQLDGAGASLGRVTVTYGGNDIPCAERGALFTPPSGISVDKGCVDIRVRLLEVVSGQYVYRPCGGGAEVTFEPPLPWHYDEAGGRQEGLSDEVCLKVESKRRRRMRPGFTFLGVLAALLSLVLLLWVILAPYFDYLKEFEKRQESSYVYFEEDAGRLTDISGADQSF